MNSADVRDWDPGDRQTFTPESTRTSPRPAPTPRSATRSGAGPPGIWPVAADHFREGLVVCDGAGVVRHVTEVAATLLPGVAVGELLAASGIDALRLAGDAADPSRVAGDAADPIQFTHAGRRLRIRRVPLGGDRCGWYVEDVTEAVDRADTLLAERSRSGFLATASQKLGNPLHADRAARAAARLAVPVLGEVAVVVLHPRAGRVRWWRAVAHGDGTPRVDGGVLPVPDLPPAVTEALGGVEPHTADWLAEQLSDAGWLSGLTPPDACVRVVPLPGSGAPTGALVLVRPAARPFDDADVLVLRGFAARAGAALNAALLYRDQAEIAETLQSSLLPVPPTPVPGIRWGAAYRPSQATLRIGGDFYGTHPLPDGGSLFFLGDVSGKGVEAAVFTGQLRQGLQALRRVETDPRRLLLLLNDAVLETTQANGQGRFATMVLGLAQPTRDGGLSLTLSGGGHLPPLLLRADGEVEYVPLRGMLIGVVPDPRIGQSTVHLAAGETCLLFSDGVTEARGGLRGDEQYGTDRLVHALRGCHRMPAPALAERVEQLTCDWLAGGDHDDIAVLAVQAGRAGGGAVPGARHLHSVPATGPAGPESDGRVSRSTDPTGS